MYLLSFVMTYFERQAKIAELKRQLVDAMNAYVIAIREKENRNNIELRYSEVNKIKRELWLLQNYD